MDKFFFEEMVYFELTQSMPLERLVDARRVDGVRRAEAISLSGGRWRSPDGKIAPLRIIGFDPDGTLFRVGDVLEGDLDDLKEPFAIMTDKTNLDSLRLDGIGSSAEVNSAPANLAGLTTGTQSIVSSTMLFTSLENARAYSTSGLTSSVFCSVGAGDGLSCTTTYETRDESDNEPPEIAALTIADPITHILIQAEAGEDLEQIKQRLEDALPNVIALTQAEMADRTRNYWRLRTGIAAVGMIVGMVIVGQILYSSVSDHIREYGTLKAMGASDRMIYSVIIEQALWMAVLGYIPSILLCLGLGAWTVATQGIMILITPLTATGLFGVTVVMCVGSALFAIQKVTHVDPAIVFKA